MFCPARTNVTDNVFGDYGTVKVEITVATGIIIGVDRGSRRLLFSHPMEIQRASPRRTNLDLSARRCLWIARGGLRADFSTFHRFVAY